MSDQTTLGTFARRQLDNSANSARAGAELEAAKLARTLDETRTPGY